MLIKFPESIKKGMFRGVKLSLRVGKIRLTVYFKHGRTILLYCLLECYFTLITQHFKEYIIFSHELTSNVLYYMRREEASTGAYWKKRRIISLCGYLQSSKDKKLRKFGDCHWLVTELLQKWHVLQIFFFLV